MAVNMNTLPVKNVEEEFYEEDGSIVVKYKAFVPRMDERGFMKFDLKEVESVEIFDDVEEERLYWE